MHIEPGMLTPHKIRGANIAAVALLLVAAPAWLTRAALWLRTALAAVFFTRFMQAFPMKVGPSKLHFVGAMPIYLVRLAVNALAFSLVLLVSGFTVLIVRSVCDVRWTRVGFDERLTAGA